MLFFGRVFLQGLWGRLPPISGELFYLPLATIGTCSHHTSHAEALEDSKMQSMRVNVDLRMRHVCNNHCLLYTSPSPRDRG